MDICEFNNFDDTIAPTVNDTQYEFKEGGAANILSDRETILRKLTTALYSARFCGLCLENSNELCTTKANYEIIIDGNTYEESMMDILLEVFQDVQHIPSNNNICIQCLDKTIQSYIFIKNTKETAKVINNYVNSFYSKTLQLGNRTDPIHDYSDTKFVMVIENDEVADDFECLDDTYYIKAETYLDEDTMRAKLTLDLSDKSKYTKQENVKFTEEAKRTKAAMSLQSSTNNNMTRLKVQSIQSLNTQNNTFRCEECDLTVTTFKQWQKHEHTYHNKRVSLPDAVTDAHTQAGHYESAQEDDSNNHQCTMCLNYYNNNQIKSHPCRFKCVDCTIMPCIHYNYLSSYRHQTVRSVKKIKCLVCDYECHKKENLIAHVNEKHLNYHPYKCNICHMRYYSKYLLKNHIVSSHQDKNDNCNQNLKNNESVEGHENNKQQSFKDQSDAVLDIPEALSDDEEHLREDRKCKSGRKSLDCKIKCNNSNRKLRRPPILECSICNIKFDLKGEYLRHIKSHGSNVKYPCRICDIEFDKLRKLTLHNRKHRKPNTAHSKVLEAKMKSDNDLLKVNHLCDTCGKSFPTKILWYYHKKVHLKQIPCKLCNKLIRPVSVSSHKRFHELKQNPALPRRWVDPNRPRTHKCTYCEYATFSSGSLEAHVNRHHLKVKPYFCDEEGCDVAYSCKYQLKGHKLSMHTAEKWFTCTVCNSTLRNYYSYKKHMMQHNGERPYVCDVCGGRFKTVTMMKDHRKKHEGKTIRCPLCSRMFHLLKEVRIHIRRCHWKHKNKPFDYTKVEGLSEKDYHIFFDRRKVFDDVSIKFTNDEG